MKKALHRPEMAFLREKDGKIYPEELCVEEIVAAVNLGIQGEWGIASLETVILQKIYNWICRYMNEGATEEFLNDLNYHLRVVQYSNYVVPSDFFSPAAEGPQSVYVVNSNIEYSPDTFAAKEISRFVTYGMIDKLRRCQLASCQNIFIGPPNAKWCSKTCGSKYRVKKKRKRDLS